MASQNTTKKIDPLYTIFEQHLFNFQDPNSERGTFVEGIIKEYLVRMRGMGLSVPVEWEEQIFEELFFQVNSMLVKKIYGCHTIDEYTAKATPAQKRKAQTQYRKLERASLSATRAAAKASNPSKAAKSNKTAA